MNEETKPQIEKIDNDNTPENTAKEASVPAAREAQAEEKPTEHREEARAEENQITEEEKQEIISDFAPEPISIPNYNPQKEKEKHIKKRVKTKKKLSAKSRARRRLAKKVARGVASLLLLVVLTAALTGTLSSLLVRITTSEYSVENAIRKNNPEQFTIGKIQDISALNLKAGSAHASIADILRDNAMSTTTYEDIAQAVKKSGFSAFAAKHASGVISSLVFGTEYKGITAAEVTKVFRENISYIKLATGVELGESACAQFGKYIAETSALNDIKPENLKNTTAAKHTDMTKRLFSFTALAAMAAVIVLAVVIVTLVCRGYAHKIVGGSLILSGMITAAAGILYKPWFATSNAFIQCVIDSVLKAFRTNAIIYALAAVIIGVLVLLIGKAVSYGEEYEEE